MSFIFDDNLDYLPPKAKETTSGHGGSFHPNTVQAIRNITNFLCKKCIFERIRTNFILKFVHEIREMFVHEFMPEDYIFKEKIWGKYQYH